MMTGELVQSYARAAGVLFLISIIAGGFGEAYIPSVFFVSGDSVATATNLRTSELIFRVGFASYLIEAVCDIALLLILYVLLSPVNRNLALMSAFFGLVATAVFAASQLFSFAALHFVSDAQYLSAFPPEQLNTLMLLSVKYSQLGGGIFMVFYGVATALRGYLIFCSGFLPRFLGVLLLVAGLSFIIRNFLFVLIPEYASNFFLIPMFIAVVTFAAWLLIKGIDVKKWQAWKRLATEGSVQTS